jgi:ribosomal protein L16 Arg81 hydroxylase
MTDALPNVLPAADVEESARAVLRQLLSPVSLDAFFSRYYEREHCLIKRGKPDFFNSLVSIDAIDEVLGTMHLRHPSVKVANAAVEDIKTSGWTYEGKVADPVKLAKMFADGTTLIFPHLHQRLPTLRSFCGKLSRCFSSRMQTNIYLTPPDAQGFHPHWDTHDVFILQVSGSKRWKIYDTKTELPLRGQAFSLKNPEHEAGEVTREFLMEPGDTLYMPRGLMHSADSLDEPSLHITTGIMAYTWTRLLLEALSQVAVENVELRRNLPIGFFEEGFGAERRAALVQEKLQLICEQVDSEAAFDHFADDLISRHRPPLGDLLRQVLASDSVTASSRIEPRPDAVIRLIEKDETITIKAFGNETTLPSFVADAVHFALNTPRFSVADLPDVVDEAGKIVLVRRLIKEGLLVNLDVLA